MFLEVGSGAAQVVCAPALIKGLHSFSPDQSHALSTTVTDLWRESFRCAIAGLCCLGARRCVSKRVTNSARYCRRTSRPSAFCWSPLSTNTCSAKISGIPSINSHSKQLVCSIYFVQLLTRGGLSVPGWMQAFLQHERSEWKATYLRTTYVKRKHKRGPEQHHLSPLTTLASLHHHQQNFLLSHIFRGRRHLPDLEFQPPVAPSLGSSALQSRNLISFTARQ